MLEILQNIKLLIESCHFPSTCISHLNYLSKSGHLSPIGITVVCLQITHNIKVIFYCATYFVVCYKPVSHFQG